jgi:hypothetical protein
LSYEKEAKRLLFLWLVLDLMAARTRHRPLGKRLVATTSGIKVFLLLFRKTKEESSFFEKKEAKKLYSLG